MTTYTLPRRCTAIGCPRTADDYCPEHRPAFDDAAPAPVRDAADVDTVDTVELIVRGRRYTARREHVAGRGDAIAIYGGAPGHRRAFAGEVYQPPLHLPDASPVVIGCPTSWSATDSRQAAREALAALGSIR